MVATDDEKPYMLLRRFARQQWLVRPIEFH